MQIFVCPSFYPRFPYLPFCLLLACLAAPVWLAGQRSVGLLARQSGFSEGYTLFHPIRSTTTYLIDDCGREVHRWESDFTPGNSVYLLDDGRLLRTAKTTLDANPVFVAGGAGERVQLLDWDGTLRAPGRPWT